MQTISEVLKNETAAPPVQSEEATPVEQEAAPEAESTGEQDEGATPGATEQQRLVPVAALQDERRKRQEAAELVRELQARIDAIERDTQARRQPAPEPEPELTEDAIMADLPKAFKTVERKFEQRLDGMRYQMSEAQARKIYNDYDEVIQEYVQLARQNPVVAQQVHMDAAPAFAAYDYVKKARAAREASDPKKLEEKIQAEVSKRLQAELDKLKAIPAAQQVPQSIGSVRGSGATSNPAWSGPPSMSDILKKR